MIPLDKIGGVLWDLDGVLADTGELHYLAMVAALQPHRVDFPRSVYLQTFGTNIRSVLTVTLGSPPAEDFAAVIQTAQGENFCRLARGNLQPAAGALATLEFFRARGIRQAIASSAEDFVIDAIVDEIGIRPYFDAIVAGAKLPSKPAPAIFLQAAHVIQIPPALCLVIEDSPAGIRGAKQAGMYAAAITTSHPQAALAPADVVVDTLTEIWG